MIKTSLFLIGLLFASATFAQQSSITEAEGSSCMGDDKSRKQTENAALQDAKRMAVDFTQTHIESESVIENFELKKDLVQAFSKADVQIIEILSKEWENPVDGDCYIIRIKAEVIPSEKDMARVDQTSLMTNPRSPLNVKLWTNADTFVAGEVMKIYLQANKPFYARLVYVSADGNNLQLLPNQHRTDNYFAGGTIFEVPANKDGFELLVGEPFGAEKLILYASTNQLGNIETTSVGNDVFLLKDSQPNIAAKTRGISISSGDSSSSNSKTMKKTVAEFSETSVEVTTSER